MIESKERSKIFQGNCELITESINELTIIINQIGEIEYINSLPLIKSLGYKSDDLIGNSWLNYVHNEDLEIAINSLENCTESKPFVQELRLKHANGNYKNFKFYAKLNKDFNKPKDFLIILKPEQRLKESEEFYKTILDSIVDGVWVTNRDDKIYFANKSMGNIAGISADQIVDTKVLKDFPESTLKYFRSYYLNAKESLKAVYYDSVPVKTPGGRQSYQSGWLIPRIKDGIYDGIICTVEDVTESIEYEQELKESKAQLVIFNKELEQKVEERTSALKESEEKYQDLFENAPNAYFSIGADKSILMCNKAAENLLVYSKEELLKMTVLDLYVNNENGNRKAKKKFKQFFNSEPIQDEELQMKKKNGEPVWVSLTVKPIFDQKGNVKESRSMVVDISRRKKTEEELRKIDERLKYLASSGPTVIYTAKASGDYGVTFISENVKDLTGYEPEDFIKNTEIWINNIHPEDKDAVLSKLSKISKEKSLGYEYRFKFKDGIYHWMRDESKLIIDDRGNPIQLIGSWSDITWSKKSEEKLQFQAKLVDNVSDAIISTDLNFKIITWNKAAESIYGWKADETTGKYVYDIIPSEYSDSDTETATKQFLEEGFWNGEVIQPHKEGTPINILASVSLIKNVTGESIGAVAINRDFTERIKAKNELRERESSYKRLAENLPGLVYRVMSNQNNSMKFFNNMLQPMTGYTKDELITGEVCSIDPLIYSEDRTNVIKNIKNAIRENRPFELEYRLKHKDGSIKWFYERGRPIKEVDGTLSFIDGVIFDITDRMNAKQKLKESEERFKYLVSSSPSIIYTSKVSGDYGITFISNNVQEKWGYSSETFINDSDFWLNHVHPNDKENVLSMFSDLLEEEHIIYDYRFKLNDGTYRWMLDEVELVKDKEGNPIETIGSVIDINEQKKVENLIKEKNEFLTSILESLTHPFYVINTENYNIELANSAAFSGLLTNTSKCYKLTHMIDDPCESEHPCPLNVVKKSKKPCRVEHIHYDKNGNPIHVEIHGYPIFDKEGNVEKMIEYSIDISERRYAEKKLRESEKKYRTLINNIPGMIYRGKPNWTVEVITNSEVISGYKEEEFVSQKLTWVDIIHPNDKESIIKEGSLMKEKPMSISQIYRIYTKEGAVRWVNDHKISFFNEKGDFCGVDGVVYDITDRKEVEESLKESEEKYRNISNQYKMLLESITDAVYALNRDWEYILVNKNAEKIVNMPIGVLLGHTIFEVFPGVENTPFFKVYETVMNTGNAERVVNSFTQPDGHTGFYEVSVYPIKEGILCIGKDVTEEKEIEQKIKESEEKFRTITEQSSLGLIIQQDGFIKFANSAVSDIIEYPLEEIHKWTVEDTLKFIYKEDLQLIIEKLKQRQNGDFKAINQYECRAITKSGKIKWIDVYTKPIIYHGKNAVLSTFIDITEKKKVEEELKEISRLKSDLLSRTSHELKTPLVSIKGYADLLLTQHYEELDFYTVSILHEVKQGCSRLESLIKDLLETSKLESGEIELFKTKDDLAFLIRFCIRDLKGLVETRNHELILDIKDEMITYFEKEKIYEVLMNLISNAIKYTPKNGKITIRAEVQNGNYVMSVQDTGIGLTDEEKAKIFKKFGKVERYGQGLDVISEGSGLGLYISKKIIELHEGNIWVESEGRKQGSIFYFSLPILKK